MKPDVDFVLRLGGNTLLTQILPALESSHFQGATYLISILLDFAAQEYERGAEVRVRDNDGMRMLFAEAAGKVNDPEMIEKLIAAAGTRESSLRISELDRVNDLMKELFIQLQTLIEDMPGAWARDFEGRMLGHLVDRANWHELKLPEEAA